MFDVELDRSSPFKQIQDTNNQVPWTGEGDYRELPMKPIIDHPFPSLTSTHHDLVEHSADQG